MLRVTVAPEEEKEKEKVLSQRVGALTLHQFTRHEPRRACRVFRAVVTRTDCTHRTMHAVTEMLSCLDSLHGLHLQACHEDATKRDL